MKYFATGFIVSVFVSMYVVFPIMDALEIPVITDILYLLFSSRHLFFVFFISFIIFSVLFLLFKSLQKSKTV